MIPSDPAWIAIPDAAKRLGCCKRVLTDLCRRDLLPWPDAHGRLPVAAVEGLERKWVADRRS